MNATQFFSSPTIHALGWSLVHSLWQGLICVVVALVVLHCIPSKRSSARYAVATVTLLVIFLISLTTFIYLNDFFERAPVEGAASAYYAYPLENLEQENNYFGGLLQMFTSTLQNYLPFIVLCWGVGTLLFSFRLFGGWLTIKKLKASAVGVDAEWNERMQYLANKLGIREMVLLAESTVAQAPVVIGYFKPMILIPVGMFSGLSTEQLETIFIHELIHIRRRDYLVNLLQSLLEAVYFFNPFVWMISGIIKREREHCCDDAVIALHGNPLAYAHALTALEEVRLSRAGFALSLAENKNQLLNRIKRIMEKSVKPYSLRERIVPAVLLITGLVCASWITIQSGRSVKEQNKPSVSFQQTTSPDTTIKIEKSGRYYKKTITTMGADGKPHEEVVEEFNGDGDLLPLSISEIFDFPLPIAAPMDINIAIPTIPAFPPMEMIDVMPPIPAFNFDMNITLDTIPFPPGPQFDLRHDKDWEEFGKEFENHFRARFGDFYEKHEKEIEEMMKDIESRFDSRSMEEWAEHMHLKSLDAQLSQLQQQEEMASLQEEQVKSLEEQMERWSEDNEKNLEQLENQVKALEDSRLVFEKEFREQLIKDGYLKANEDIKSIEINDESIKINDKTIKDTDQKKYREILKKNSFGPSPPHPFPGRRE
ncbi:MAG TPA: M56 family metallopeptidase [Chryseolinea sp.]|nr:M56 family metallopeptidase [Chryseolinea sp.]